MSIVKVLKIWHRYRLTVSRMTFFQVYWRIRRIVSERVWWQILKSPLPNYSAIAIIGKQPPPFGHRLEMAILCDVIPKADRLCQGEFTFLNQRLSFNSALPEWSASPDGDRLWTYNLHYFEYVYDILWAFQSTKDPSYIQSLRKLIHDWIDKNPFGSPIAWNPYPLARRIIVWCNLAGYLVKGGASGDSTDRIVSSLCQQAEFLAHNLEYDIDNNHLITDARALVWAGLFLRGHTMASQWYQQGFNILLQEASRQILHDGGHWERSTSYHMVVLQDYLETLLLLRQMDMNVPESLVQVVNSMFEYLSKIARPDGTLPLLNDSVEGYPVPFTDLCAVGAVYLQKPELKAYVTQEPGPYFYWLLGKEGARAFAAQDVQELPSTSATLMDTGYFVMREQNHKDKTYLIFDCGPIGPDHSSAHAHADVLSFELAAAGETLIVDPGTYEYKAGVWRDYFRSTRAHNTVTVDGLDQSVFWGSFRVAEMARPRLLCWDETDEYVLVEGEHDGYTRLASPVIHRRSIRYQKPDRWIIIDTLESDGKAPHQYTLWFHLALATCKVDLVSNCCTAKFPKQRILTIVPEHPPDTVAEIQEGWISNTWKKKHQAPVLCYSLTSRAPRTVFKTTITTSFHNDGQRG